MGEGVAVLTDSGGERGGREEKGGRLVLGLGDGGKGASGGSAEETGVLGVTARGIGGGGKALADGRE